MTDDRIAELMGLQLRSMRDSSLMHRIRIIAAEAEAAAHVVCADRIAQHAAQIERMRAALVAARYSLATTLAETERGRAMLEGIGIVEGAEAAAVIEEYRAALRQIDEAIGEQA